jgi:uncharacterized protein
MHRNAPFAAMLALAAMISPAAAFDCAKAATAVETAICSDPGLKRLDDELEAAYAAVKAASSPAEQKMLVRSQKRWIAGREQCPGAEAGLSSCVRTALEERLRLLRGEADSGPGPSSKLMPVFVVQDGTETVYDLDIAVLRFVDARTAGERKLNDIANDIVSRVTVGPHGQDTMGRIYAQQDAMSLTYASPGFLSVLHSYWADEGGAHGNGGIENFNIDMQTGRTLEIGDVMTEEGAAEMMSRCKEQVIAEKKRRMADVEDYDVATDDFIRDDVISEHVATLSRWRIGADWITITFDAYAIGSYAEGSYECRFATAEVKAMALPGALIP